jgi:hypothetical protein
VINYRLALIPRLQQVPLQRMWGLVLANRLLGSSELPSILGSRADSQRAPEMARDCTSRSVRY